MIGWSWHLCFVWFRYSSSSGGTLVWWTRPFFAVKHFTFQGLVVATVQNETNCTGFRLIRGCVLLICDAGRTFLLVALVDSVGLN